ncbi:MAG: hypothetical protein MK319_13995, partial [Pseudomonadales bacterium]|nr:hypothetical protein [Pseudomonadales bacterium]
ILLVVVAQNPHEMLLGSNIIYVASGPCVWLFRKRTGVKALVAEENQAKSSKRKKKQPVKNE